MDSNALSLTWVHPHLRVSAIGLTHHFDGDFDLAKAHWRTAFHRGRLGGRARSSAFYILGRVSVCPYLPLHACATPSLEDGGDRWPADCDFIRRWALGG